MPELVCAADDPIRSNLASLNEIVAELVAAVSDDPDFVNMCRAVLRESSWSLGYTFQGETRHG